MECDSFTEWYGSIERHVSRERHRSIKCDGFMEHYGTGLLVDAKGFKSQSSLRFMRRMEFLSGKFEDLFFRRWWRLQWSMLHMGSSGFVQFDLVLESDIFLIRGISNVR